MGTRGRIYLVLAVLAALVIFLGAWWGFAHMSPPGGDPWTYNDKLG